MAARTFSVALLACISLTACSQNSSGRLPRQNLELITREQITENNFINAYDAVQAIRSNWLQAHGPNSFQTPSEVIVYRDNVRLGGVEELRGMETMTIAYIRHYNGVEATSRWGVGHAAGVIQVSSFTKGRD
jgi:hypothetical protein